MRSRLIRMACGVGCAVFLQIIAQAYLTDPEDARLFSALWKLANAINGSVVGLAVAWICLQGKLDEYSTDGRHIARALIIGSFVIGGSIG